MEEVYTAHIILVCHMATPQLSLTLTGGAVHCNDNSGVLFEGNSRTTFSHNFAMQGGLVTLIVHS